jgi:hypothetical protein
MGELFVLNAEDGMSQVYCDANCISLLSRWLAAASLSQNHPVTHTRPQTRTTPSKTGTRRTRPVAARAPLRLKCSLRVNSYLLRVDVLIQLT